MLNDATGLNLDDGGLVPESAAISPHPPAHPAVKSSSTGKKGVKPLTLPAGASKPMHMTRREKRLTNDIQRLQKKEGKDDARLLKLQNKHIRISQKMPKLSRD
jgi:hypothetical protein